MRRGVRRAAACRAAAAALILAALSVSGCAGTDRAVADALAVVELSYDRIRDQARDLAPDRATRLEAAIADARATVASGDLRTSRRTIHELRTRVKDLSLRLPALRSEVEGTWEELESSLPGTLFRLDRRLGLMHRPAAGPGRAEFDSARNELAELLVRWRDARTTMREGRLMGAVRMAEDVKRRAVRLLTETRESS